VRSLPDVLEFFQQVHPYWRNDDLLKGMKELGIHVTAYSPLGSEVKDQPSLLQDETLKKVRSQDASRLLFFSENWHEQLTA
jgi:diketogulonate reductase-like aldo/keto reductase